MNATLQRILNSIKAAFEAEPEFPNLTALAPIARAIGWDQISEQVWKAARDIYLDCYPYITGFYQDGGQTFVVISHEGKLYRHMVTITDDAITLGAGEPVMVDFVPVARSITIYRQADGRIRGVGIVATAVLNRVGEIDSRALFDSFIEHWRETGDNPTLQFYHLGEQSRMGEIDYLARDDSLFINSWLFDDNAIGRAAALALETEPNYWGFSIGYLPTCDPEMMRVTDGVAIPVYTQGIQRETSILAERRAAALFTMPLTGVNRMNPEIKQDLGKLMGGDATLTDEVEKLIDTRSRQITQAGLITRADEGGESLTITDADGNETTVTATPTVELDEPAIEAIAQAVQNGEQFAALVSALDTLTQTVKALGEIVTGQGQTLATQTRSIDQRLQALEADDEIRREDMPAGSILRVTHRPRLQRAADGAAGADSETMADKAAKVTENMPTY